MRIRRIWIILIISLACFLVINAPAKILTPYLKSSINFPFTLNGSIWNGSMQSKYFDIVSWKVNTSSLLLAKVSTEIQVEIDKLNKINAEANINPFGKLKINITSGSLTTQYLQQFLPNIPFLLSSTINLDQTILQWSSQLPPNLPTEAEGKLVIKRANFLGENLGDYLFNFTYTGRSLDGELASSESSNVDALLKVALSNKNLLTIKGSILPKSESLKSIFDELNVDLNPNIKLNLSF